MEKPRLDITFVSDVACPWCAIGLASIDKALGKIGDDIDARITVEPFELNPDMGPEGANVMEYITKKYGRTREQVAEVQARIRERGADAGFIFGPREHIWNTFDAHRMLHWATLEGKGAELKRALLKAYHGEGRNPAASDVLVAAARSVGLDPLRAQAIVDSNEFAHEVRAREQHWQRMGVSGVPFVVINNQYAIEGGQPPETFEQAFRQIAVEK